MSPTFHAQQRLLKRAYFAALGAARRDEQLLRRHGQSNHALILNIHSVNPSPKPYWPSVHPLTFGKLLEWLAPRSTVTLLSNLAADARSGARRPLVVLSFDDGYRDFVDHAMPVLDRLGLKANQNVIGESVETGQPPEIVRFCDFLAGAPTKLIETLRLPGFNTRLSSDDPLAKERFGAVIMNHLKQTPLARRAEIWDSLEETMRKVEIERPTQMMSKDDVVAAAAAGHEIGWHSYSHESMEFLSDEDFLADFERCRKVLAMLGCDSKVYAFPNGSYHEGQVTLLRERGVDHLLLVGERPSSPDANVHTRLTLRGHTAPELRARAVGLTAPPAFRWVS